jgi:uncharacterized membrane protein
MRRRGSSERLECLDALRGLVMVLMALDHSRDFFHFRSIRHLSSMDLATTTAPIFLTRWVTHFCAPVFFFLAGSGAFLSEAGGKSKRDLSIFLVTRGLWLVFLELTFVNWVGWNFGVDLHMNQAYVLWAIGWCMVALAGLIHLPIEGVAAFGVGMIVVHDAFDGVGPEAWGAAGGLWKVLHAGGKAEFAPGYFLDAGYPLIPWIGVMAAGYAFGPVLRLDPAARQKAALRLGGALILGFALLRLSNLYGDPVPWSVQSRPGMTALSVLKCMKYPPSLSYLLMTLGPALCLLAWLDRGVPPWLRFARTFGRVPMFFYLIHIPLLHAMAVVEETLRVGRADWLIGDQWNAGPIPLPAGAGVGLLGVYGAWAAAVLALYPVCAWFAELKRRRRDWWLGYF